jgi:hypothetical protein
MAKYILEAVECVGLRTIYFMWRDSDGDQGTDVIGDVTEAEANIIAFVLNAVAEGHTLAAGDDYGFGWQSYTTYAGPTDGVAP